MITRLSSATKEVLIGDGLPTVLIGDFIKQPHTMRHCRTAQWRPTVLNRASRDNWEKAGSPDLREKARQKALHILATHEVPALPATHTAMVERLIGEYEAAFIGEYEAARQR